MTIALGILATDGVVIGADTQEGSGYAGGTKTSGKKILLSERHNGALAVSGCGPAGYLDSIGQELTNVFAAQRKLSPVDFKGDCERRVYEFNIKHVVPLKGLPDPPDIRLVIGADIDGRHYLLSSEHSAVSQHDGWVAVGAGQNHARMLLSRLFISSMDIEMATLLAAYTVFSTKEYIEGVGKNTHVVRIQNRKVAYVSDAKVALMEQQFDEYAHWDRQAFHYAIGHPVHSTEEALRTLSDHLQSLRSNAIKLPRLQISTSRWGLPVTPPMPADVMVVVPPDTGPPTYAKLKGADVTVGPEVSNAEPTPAPSRKRKRRRASR